VELLVRWTCACVPPGELCPRCKGKGYLERWIPRNLLRNALGDSSFLVLGRRSVRTGIPLPAFEPKRYTEVGSTLFVDGLPSSFTREQLRGLFATVGTVLWSRIVADADGRCSGFGYVDMETADEAQKAAKRLDGYKLADSSLAVMISSRTPQALQAERFLALNIGKAFCELCIRSHISAAGSSRELLDAFSYLYECYRVTGHCFECDKMTQVFAAGRSVRTQG
jgi:RNA recognition motif